MILLVDDESHIRDVVRFALEKAGFEVCEAANGEEALALFASHQPELIVLDAQTLAEPIARVPLKSHIPHGFHGGWTPL